MLQKQNKMTQTEKIITINTCGKSDDRSYMCLVVDMLNIAKEAGYTHVENWNWGYAKPINEAIKLLDYEI